MSAVSTLGVRLEKRETGDGEWDQWLVNDGDLAVRVSCVLHYEGMAGDAEKVVLLGPGEQVLLDSADFGPSPVTFTGATILRVDALGA